MASGARASARSSAAVPVAGSCRAGPATGSSPARRSSVAAFLLAIGGFSIVAFVVLTGIVVARDHVPVVARGRGQAPGVQPADDAGDRLRVRARPAAAALTPLRGDLARRCPLRRRLLHRVGPRGRSARAAAPRTRSSARWSSPAIATVISVPIGLMAAIYLNEYGTGRLRKALTFFVDVMTGIPSIVAGLFAYALFELFLGPGHPARDHGLDRAHGADDPDRDPLIGGDPQDRPQPPARGRLRARARRSGRRSPRSSCRPRSPAWSPG